MKKNNVIDVVRERINAGQVVAYDIMTTGGEVIFHDNGTLFLRTESDLTTLCHFLYGDNGESEAEALVEVETVLMGDEEYLSPDVPED